MASGNHGINDNYVSFTINSVPYKVTTNVPLETSLNSYIRDYAQLKGTKYMCKEGGCGACVVAITTTNPFTNRRNTYAVNSTYDPPGALDIPEIFDVTLENRPKLGAEHPSEAMEVDKLKGVIGAKATGEPPLCLSIAVLFAIKDAIKNARKDAGLSGDFTFIPPATIENNLLNSSTETSQFKLRSK